MALPSPPPRLFCPICLQRDPHTSAPLYPRCKPFHLLIPASEPALLPTDCGVCALAPDEFTALPLRRITSHNHDTSLLEFSLSSPEASLNLPPLTHLIVRAPDCEHGGGDAERAYTSVSPPHVSGSFCIMVKRYQAWGDPAFAHSYKPPGAVSNYLHSLRPGDTVLMRHNATAHVRLRYPFAAAGVARVTMICVGVGVAPMVQCLHHVFADAADSTEITLIYGNRSIADVLQREQLESWAAAHAPPRFRLVLVIGSRYANVRMHRDDCPPKCKLVHPPPAPLGWDAFAGPFERELGWVDEAVIRRHAHAPAADTRVIVCGLPGVYDAICGPRKEALREGSYLANIGFTDAMVVKL